MAGAKPGEGDESAKRLHDPTRSPSVVRAPARMLARTGTQQLIAIVAPDTEPVERA